MSGQHPGVLQSLARQPPGMGDAQLLQQQVTLKQMQELQRQQQIQQLEAMQRNTMNQISSFSNQAAGNHALPSINGTPMYEVPNYPWSSQVMTGSPDWLQHGASHALQGYSNGVVMPPEQGQSLRLMGLIPHQAQQSLSDVPISSARSGGGFLMNQFDKTGLHQVPVQGNFSGNQHPLLAEQMNLHDGMVVSKQGFEGRGFCEKTFRQGSGNAISVDNFNETKQRSVQELDGKQNVAVSIAPFLSGQAKKQVASSQDPVALDPTEEKILFGSDDNIWDTFGGSLSETTGGVSHSDGVFPSTQSGSWSALMQSAVAESSSSDIGLQDEWKGVGLQNSGSLTVNQQLSRITDKGGQPAVWVDGSAEVSISSRSLPDACFRSGYHNLGLQNSLTNQTKEVLLNRSSQQSLEGKKWLGCSQPMAIAEDSQSHESPFFSGDFSSKNTMASSLANRLDGLNFMQPVSDGGKMSKDQEKFQGDDIDRSMTVNIGDSERTSIPSVHTDSNVEMEKQHINSKNDVCILNDNHQREFRTSVNSDVKSGADGYQQHLNKGMEQVFHSSTNSCDHGIAEMSNSGNGVKRENFSYSCCSNLSNRASTGGVREHVRLDAGDMHGMSGGKQSSSGQVTEHQHSVVQKGHDWQSRFLCPRTNHSSELEKSPLSNFQGDIRASYGISPSCNLPRYVSLTSLDKSGDITTSNNSVTSSQNMLELLHKVDQSKERNTMANLSSSDPNRLSSTSEAEAPPSQGFGLQLAPPSHGLPTPNFLMASQSLNSSSSSYNPCDKGDKSHAWLAPAVSSQSLSSLHDVQQGEPHISRSDIPRKIHEPLACNTQVPFGSLYLKNLLHNQKLANAGMKLNCEQPVNVSFDRQVPHDKQVLSALAQKENTLSPGTYQSDEQVSMQQMITLSVSSSLHPDLWNNLTMPQQLLASQSLNTAELLKNEFHSNNIPGTSASIQKTQDGHDTMRKVDDMNSQGSVGGDEQPLTSRLADATRKSEIMLQGKETFPTNPFEAFPNSAATKEDIEAFGRSLLPNSNMVDNYALLHQMQTMKEMDPYIWRQKRFKGPDNGPENHHMVGKSEHCSGLNYGDKNASASCTSVSSTDAKMPSFTPEPGNDQEKHIQQQHVDAASEDLLFHQVEPQELSNGNMAARAEHSQISLQMAPTWFKQYGTFKNGQLIPVHDMERAQLVTNTEQRFMFSKSLKGLGAETDFGQANTVIDMSQMANVWQKPPHIPSEVLSSHHPLSSGDRAPGIASLRPKKRKSAATGLLPWHKEVAMGYERLPSMSSAEEYWAHAACRLIEKFEDETDVHDDVSPVVRSRRRLVLTMQLMQQIFQPPPASIFSLIASKEYETVGFFAARLVLADACSLTCQSKCNSSLSQDEEKLPSEKPKANGRIRDQYLSKVVEQFTDRARIMENDLLRLDKRISVLDLRLECQDLERFSVINRFARFHGRGQVDGTETFSTSDTTAAAQRARPQRYVHVCPTPKNLPERVQCLSL